jgi:hypothetical protein
MNFWMYAESNGYILMPVAFPSPMNDLKQVLLPTSVDISK